MGSIEIRRLCVSDVEDFRDIRLAALKGASEAFGSTYEVEAAWPVSVFAERLSSSAVFGAYVGGHIVGMVGFKQHAGPKDSHKAFVWGMYVRRDARRLGVGAALIEALLQPAGTIVEQLTLTVMQGNEAAIAPYDKFGFELYGIEPRALKSPAGYSDEVLMVRFLRPF